MNTCPPLNILKRLSIEQLQARFAREKLFPVKCFITPETGTVIERAVRIREDEDVHDISRISYCPKAFMSEQMQTNYQRCNLPGQEIFYGSIIEPYEDSENFAAMVSTSICETSELYRNVGAADGEEFYLFGGWHVVGELTCMLILDPSRQYSLRFLNEAQEVHRQKMKEKGLKNGLLFKKLVTAFSSHVVDNDDYRVSAAFSDFVFKNYVVDAIIYPSVQTDAKGLCIAIKPEVIDGGRLVAHRVLKDVVRRKGMTITADIIEAANIKEGETSFTLKPYEGKKQ